VYDESASSTQVFDVGQLRLRFKVSASGCEPLNVRFDPVAMTFHWLPDGSFTWNELMFEPKECIAKLRRNQSPV
jgi:predicted ester cyclase